MSLAVPEVSLRPSCLRLTASFVERTLITPSVAPVVPAGTIAYVGLDACFEKTKLPPAAIVSVLPVRVPPVAVTLLDEVTPETDGFEDEVVIPQMKVPVAPAAML